MEEDPHDSAATAQVPILKNGRSTSVLVRTVLGETRPENLLFSSYRTCASPVGPMIRNTTIIFNLDGVSASTDPTGFSPSQSSFPGWASSRLLQADSLPLFNMPNHSRTAQLAEISATAFPALRDYYTKAEKRLERLHQPVGEKNARSQNSPTARDLETRSS